MYEGQTESVTKQRMLDRITGIIDKLEGSFTHDAVSPVALELAMLYTELDRIITLAFAQTSFGEYLDKRAAEFGVTRKAGSKATGAARFSGTNGTVIPAGTQVQTAGGLVFITLAEGTIAAGTIDINIQAQDIGTIYNVPIGAITQLPVQIVGVTSITNPGSTTGGSDVETDIDLQARLQAKVQQPSTSGNANDYRLWALSILGVGDAKVFSTWSGNGTVKVVLVDVEKHPASAQIVEDVQDYIDNVRPIGATITVAAAQGLNIDVVMTVTRDSAYSVAQVTANITAKLTAYLKSIAFMTTYVSYAQIGNAIIDSQGVLDYTNLTVNGGVANVPVGSEQVPVLGVVTVNE